jgi:3-oxoacyl-[acyl-carrier-protein] synthase-3
MARSFVESGEYRTVLVIAGDVLSKITDWQDRSTCVLFGDGAGAAVVTASDEDGRGILGFDIGADGSAGDLLKIPGGGSRIPMSQRVIDERLHYIKMVGNEVFKYAVRVMEGSVLKLLRSLGLSVEDIGCFIPHQANMRIISAMVERLGIPMDVVYVNVDRYGNVSAASVAIALDEARKEGRIKDGDLVVMTAFGGGFTWGSCAVRW